MIFTNINKIFRTGQKGDMLIPDIQIFLLYLLLQMIKIVCVKKFCKSNA